MQIKRIKPGQWYMTKEGIGKCLKVGANNHLKFEIDKKEVYLSSTEVQHEIAPGQEPQDENAATPPDVERVVAELHRLRASNAAMLEALEHVQADIGERLTGKTMLMIRAAIAKAKLTP